MDWRRRRRRHGKDKRQCLEIVNQTKRNPRHIKRTLQNVDQMLVGRDQGRRRTQKKNKDQKKVLIVALVWSMEEAKEEEEEEEEEVSYKDRDERAG